MVAFYYFLGLFAGMLLGYAIYQIIDFYQGENSYRNTMKRLENEVNGLYMDYQERLKSFLTIDDPDTGINGTSEWLIVRRSEF